MRALNPRRLVLIRRDRFITFSGYIAMHDYHAILAQAYGRPRQSLAASLIPWTTELVQDHEFALLYRQGRLIGPLATGAHRLWGRHVAVVRFDRRRQLLDIPAQELPTADGVTVKVTAQVTWQILDPVAVATRDADHRQSLYANAQLAVRAIVSAHPLAQLITSRPAIAIAMHEAMTAASAASGIAIHGATLKDVMPNAETRKAMAAVAFAKQEALASLEKARGEQAALRALSNAARLLKEQPELAQIRGLQVLEGLRGGTSVVVNAADAGLVLQRRKE